MQLKQQLLCVARTYADALGIPLTRVSHRLLGESKRLQVMADTEADITTGRFEMAMQWFSANWPADTAWPLGIDRPYIEAIRSVPGDQQAVRATA